MKKLVCIECPKGCKITVDDNLTVSGNSCKRGKLYALNEISNPKRFLTTTIKINSKLIHRLPVITSDAISKDLIFEAMKLLKTLEVNPPIKAREIIVENFMNTGVNILSSRTIND